MDTASAEDVRLSIAIESLYLANLLRAMAGMPYVFPLIGKR